MIESEDVDMRVFVLTIFVSIVAFNAQADLAADCYVQCYNNETIEVVLVQRDVVGYGECQSPAASRRWRAQCELAVRQWAPGKCSAIGGLVRGEPRCE